MIASALKSHPFEVKAFLRRSLVLTYAVPEELLRPLLSPGLELDTHEGYGFLAVAMVQTEGLRPAMLPAVFGTSFFLAGYRLFVRYRTLGGKNLRGLRILRSETDKARMVRLGNLFTHYNYRLVKADVEVDGSSLKVRVTQGGALNLDVTAHLDCPELPATTIFANEKEARRFAGPMPFTFGYDRSANRIIRVQGVREEWHPRIVEVEVRKEPSFAEFGLEPGVVAFVSAFYIEDVPYQWMKGIAEALP